MSLNRNAKLFLVIGLQVLIVLGIFVYKSLISSFGEEVRLKIRGYDPRDPLRGDYMVYRLDVSSVPTSSFAGSPETLKQGDTVYVPLRKQGFFWEVSYGVTEALPGNIEDGVTYLRGTVENEPSFSSWDSSGNFSVKYGLEEFFIPENSGKGIWIDGNNNDYIVVAIAPSGSAVLKKLFINDKEFP